MNNKIRTLKTISFGIILAWIFLKRYSTVEFNEKIQTELKNFYKNSFLELKNILRPDGVIVLTNRDHAYSLIRENIVVEDDEIGFVFHRYFTFAITKIKTENDVKTFMKRYPSMKYFVMGPYSLKLMNYIPKPDFISIKNIFDFLSNSYFENLCKNLASEIEKRRLYVDGTFKSKIDALELTYSTDRSTEVYDVVLNDVGHYRVTLFKVADVNQEFRDFYLRLKNIFDLCFKNTKNKREWTESYVTEVLRYLFEENYIFTMDVTATPSIFKDLFPFRFFNAHHSKDFKDGEAVVGGIFLDLPEKECFNNLKFKRINKFASGIYFSHFV